MLRIRCPNCDKDNFFHSHEKVPVECAYCFTTFTNSDTIAEISTVGPKVNKLTIIYQKNLRQLELPVLHKTVLGRENVGAELFSSILVNGKPVVSRTHCSIEFVDGKFYLFDEGSLNGTYYGVNKLNCKTSPQIIEDNSLFYIGEEVFHAHYTYEEEENKPMSSEVQVQSNTIKEYRCKGCGKNFTEYSEDCPDCGRYNSLIPVF